MKRLFIQTTLSAFAGVMLFYLLTSFTGNVAKPENLLGFQLNYDKQEVTITVASNGCTVKDDFRFSVTGSNVTIFRKKRDDCKAMPEPVSFTYTLKEAGLTENKKYTLKNPLIANYNIAQIN